MFNLLNILKLLFVFEMNLAYNFKLKSINTTEMALYVEHFHREYFFRQTSEVTIVLSVRDEKANYYFNELLSKYLKFIDDMKYKLEDVDRGYEHNYAYFNVVFIDSYKSFRKIDPGPKSTTEDFSEYYLIIFYATNNNTEKEIQRIFDYCWHYYIVNVALLLQTQEIKPILAYTYYPFTSKSCHNPQMQIMNRNQSILDFKQAELFPDKFRNFHGCTIMAALWNVPPYITLPKSGKDLNKMQGIEGFLLIALAQVLHFNVDYKTPPNDEQRGLVRKDGTLTGAVKMLYKREADLSFGCFRCTLERSTTLSPSMTFYQTMQVFTVLARREPWSSFEIIAYPFDFNIWFVLFALLLFILSSTHILMYSCRNVLKFIFGFSSASFVNTNVIAIVLGQTAHSMPKRNFARYIFFMWILLTLILRSVYQGSLFDFLKSQKTLTLPDSTQELTERKYKLIVNMATGDSFSGVHIIRDNKIEVLIMNISDAGGYPILEANPDKRYVTGTPKDFLTYYADQNNKYGVFHVLKETIFAQQLCVYFTKHSYLVAPFNRILEFLGNFGIINFWAGLLLDDRFLEEVDEINITQTPLTFTQLSGIIEICLYLYALTTVVFLGEILWFKYRNKNN